MPVLCSDWSALWRQLYHNRMFYKACIDVMSNHTVYIRTVQLRMIRKCEKFQPL